MSMQGNKSLTEDTETDTNAVKELGTYRWRTKSLDQKSS